MRVITTESKKTTQDILEMAKVFFEGMLGLDIDESVSNCCIEFSSDIGSVTVQVFPNGSKREVILTSQHWEPRLLEFTLGL
jgi:hypothetical protein